MFILLVRQLHFGHFAVFARDTLEHYKVKNYNSPTWKSQKHVLIFLLLTSLIEISLSLQCFLIDKKLLHTNFTCQGIDIVLSNVTPN